MPLAEDGGVENVALEPGESSVGDGKVSLLFVVEAYNLAQLRGELGVEPPSDEDDGKAAADDHEVVGEGGVLSANGRILGSTLTTTTTTCSSSSATAAASGFCSTKRHGRLLVKGWDHQRIRDLSTVKAGLDDNKGTPRCPGSRPREKIEDCGLKGPPG